MALAAVTYTFIGGDTARASEVNQNFADVINFLNNVGASTYQSGSIEREALADEVKTPIGMVSAFAGTAAPAGWLLCDGSPVSKTTYSDLFAAFGADAFGTDTASDFSLPDLRGRVPLGLDNLGGSDAGIVDAAEAESLGGVSGEEDHPLIEAELAAHGHGVNDSGHKHFPSNTAGLVTSPQELKPTDLTDTGSGGFVVGASFPVDGATTSETTGITIQSNGSGTGHNNMQPYMALGFIVYAGV